MVCTWPGCNETVEKYGCCNVHNQILDFNNEANRINNETLHKERRSPNMRFAICLFALLSMTLSVEAQCGAGGCGGGSSGVGLFRGRAVFQPTYAYADNSQYIQVNDWNQQRRPGEVVQFNSGNYGVFDGMGWKYTTAAACQGVYCGGPGSCSLGGNCNSACASCPTTPAKGYMTICKDGKCYIVKNDEQPPTLKSKLTEVTIPVGKALYQDDQNNLYILDKRAVEAAADIKPAGQFVWKQN